MPLTPFPQWVAEQTGYDLEVLEPLRLAEAFDVAVTRAEEARLRGAADPLSVIMNAVAGGNSRAVTRRMLARIGYVEARLRLMLRLLGGSKSGWRGLAKAYSDFANPAIDDAGLTPAERDYARRQIRTFLAVDSARDQDRKGSIAR